MKKLVDSLAPLGFILAIAALAWERFNLFGKALPGGLLPYLIAALALVLLHLVLRWDVVAGSLGLIPKPAGKRSASGEPGSTTRTMVARNSTA